MSGDEHTQPKGDVRLVNSGANNGQQVAVNYGEMHQYLISATRHLLASISAITGYIPRTQEEEQLTDFLMQPSKQRLVVLQGLSGTGKTWLASQVVNKIQQPPAAFAGVLWQSAADMEPHHLLHHCLTRFGNTGQQAGTANHTSRTLFWDTIAALPPEQQPILIVFDDVHSEQQATQLLPPDAQWPEHCCILLISTLTLKRWSFAHKYTIRGFSLQEAQQLFERYLELQSEQMSLYEKDLTEISQWLGSLPLLVAAAARDMHTSKISPGAYVRALHEQDNLGNRMGRGIMDGLELALRDLSADQRALFTYIGVLGEGAWRAEMLAAVAIRHPVAMQPDLDLLVERGLVQATLYGRYQVNMVVREFAQQLLKEQAAYIQHAAAKSLTYYCLDYARRLMLALLERPDLRAVTPRGMPYRNTQFVHAYREVIADEASHIRQALVWARDESQWDLLRQFADVSNAELLRYFAPSSFADIRMNFFLATIEEPVVWDHHAANDQAQPRYETRICASDWHIAKSANHSSPTADNRNHISLELGLNIQAGQVIDGHFENACLLDTQWVGVRATGMICKHVELVGCEFIACDLSQNVWFEVDAHKLMLTGSVLPYTLLKQVRLYRADLQDADLSGAVLEDVRLRGANLRNCDLTGALLDGVDLRGADLRGARIAGAVFRDVRFSDCRADRIDWNVARVVFSKTFDSGERNYFKVHFDPDGTQKDYDEQQQIHHRPEAIRKLKAISTSINDSTPSRDLDFQGGDFRAINHEDLRVSNCQFSQADFRAANINVADFSGAALNDADFRGAYLHRPNFRRAIMRGADLRTVVLSNATLEEADLTNAELRFAVIKQGQLQVAKMRGARLQNADLTGAQLQSADLSEVDLMGARLDGADLQNAKLIKANLRDAHCVGANLSGVDFTDANCDGADFSNATLDVRELAIARSWRGATLPNGMPVHTLDATKLQELLASREELERLRLAYLDGEFKDVHLDGYDLFGAQLTGDFVNVTFKQLDQARLSGTFSVVNCSNAALNGACLTGVITGGQFDGAQLANATVTGVLARCSFVGANLQKASFDGADLVGCNFTDAQLEEDQLARAFRLRGCTLPDGSRYMGSFNLPGDSQDARALGYDLEDPVQRSAFYHAEKLRRYEP